MEDFSDDQDTISLSDLPLSHQQNESITELHDPQGSDDSHEDFLFEFSEIPSSLETDSFAPDNVIFCGKILICKTEQPPPPSMSSAGLLKENNKVSSNLLTSKSSPPEATKSLIRSSSSGNSRKQRKFLIGVGKIPTKMELNDIRERQKRQAPPPMFRAVVSDEAPVVHGGSGKSRQMGLRTFSCRTHLCSGLAKVSFACFPLSKTAL